MIKSKITLTFVIAFFILCMLSSTLSAYADSHVIHVYQGQFIQDAIDAASEGSTIIVHEGIYYQSITVNKQLTLIGLGATISGAVGPESWATKVVADGVRISGFTIANAATDGILIEDEISDCLFDDNIITQCSTGISIELASKIEVRNNEIYPWGTGIFAAFASEISVKNNVIIAGGTYPGITISDSSNVEIKENTVYANGIPVSCIRGSNIVIKGNFLQGSTAGIRIFGLATTPLTGVVVADNVVVTGNRSPDRWHQGIMLTSVIEADVKNNVVSIGTNTNPLSFGISLGDSDGCKISGNLVFGDFAYGIYLLGRMGYPSTSNVLSENVIAGGARVDDIGILFTQYTSGNIAVNNIILGVSIPIQDDSGQNTFPL